MARKTKRSNDATNSDEKGSKKKGSDSTLMPDDRTPEQKLADRIRTGAGRETVEAFVVAFVLALLFRAFIAEAFVIPTGSMAPTLMGAHKDLTCQQCGCQFQVGASKERRGPVQADTVVAGMCPNCRFVNTLDLASDVNHGTFNGDRILVSKFAYTLSDPERWDVIVFKFPGNPKQNYIKRLVGLPGETLSLQFGDVFVEKNGDAQSQILRKPADKLLSMRHHVYDTDQQSPLLISSNYPSRFQPWQSGATEPPADSWKVERNEDGLTATIDDANAATTWLRYFHRWPSEAQWASAAKGGSLAQVNPYDSRLVTDFYAYDCYITVPSREIYEVLPTQSGWSRNGVFDPSYESGGPLSQFRGKARFGERSIAYEGLHWVGDLIVETDLEVAEGCNRVLLELVEAGIRYQCAISPEDGKAELFILDGDQNRAFSSGSAPTATTKFRAGSGHQVRFSNCDDQLLLWVDDQLVEFDAPTTFDSREFRSEKDNRPYYNQSVHPLDASPFGIAVEGGSATVRRVKIDRDKYYCATDNSLLGMYDYDMFELRKRTNPSASLRDIQMILATPSSWEKFGGWETRRKVSFVLDDQQFFPMGDNSPESLDARCWAGTKRGRRLPERFRDTAYRFADASYVPRDLLVGKALVVFWPHPWKTPVPFTPNFNRFRFIR